MIFDINNNAPEKIAAIEESGDTISYGELVSFTQTISDLIGKRNLIFSLCSNTIGAFAGYVSLLSSNNVQLLLSKELDKELLGYLLDTYKPNYMWLPREVDIRGAACEGMSSESLIHNIVISKYGYKLIKLNNNKPELYSELALLLTTSGSTGSPKLVRQSYTNIEANARSIVSYLEINDTERPVTMLPMNYTYGLSIINSHLLAGATILLTDSSYAQKNFWSFFREYEATSMSGVPFTYEILKKLRFFRMELPSLRYMTQAGGKLLPELHKEYAEYALEHGIRFYVMYGQTEATARMSYLPYDRSLEKYGSIGVAIPGGRFSLIDVDGHNIEENECVGELVYEGANVTLGYAECIDDLAKGDERQGILVTGDMAKRDNDGYYYIVGRKKRFLKIYGNRVNLDECERMIQTYFEGIECACTGEDDNLRIYITDQALLDDVRAYVADKTGLNIKAFDTIYIDSIPKNEAGKKLYKELE